MQTLAPTPHDLLLREIATSAVNSHLSFDDKAQRVAQYIDSLSDDDFKSLLAQSGFIPENYAHDSSEEKVYAKAMDILVAGAFKRVGFTAEVSIVKTRALSHEELVARAVAELDDKIAIIKAKKRKAEALLDVVEQIES